VPERISQRRSDLTTEPAQPRRQNMRVSQSQKEMEESEANLALIKFIFANDLDSDLSLGDAVVRLVHV
jgi:hypothetical protein